MKWRLEVWHFSFEKEKNRSIWIYFISIWIKNISIDQSRATCRDMSQKPRLHGGHLVEQIPKEQRQANVQKTLYFSLEIDIIFEIIM